VNDAPEPDEPEPEGSDQGESPKWPEPDPDKDSVWFMAGNEPGDVAVRISDGAVRKDGAPADLLSKLIDLAGDAIKDVGNLVVPPLVVSAHAGASMTVVFGETASEMPQGQLLDKQVQRSAEQIGELIGSEGDKLLSVAHGVGKGAEAYTKLLHFVQAEGIAVDWKTRPQPVQRLDQQRAASQYERLMQPPATRERALRIEGLLYRAIMDRPGSGTVGIRLAKESPVPPRHHGSTAVLRYESAEIEHLVLHELLGQMVVATVKVEEIDPTSTSIVRPELAHAIVEEIGPTSRPVTPELFDDEAEVA